MKAINIVFVEDCDDDAWLFEACLTRSNTIVPAIHRCKTLREAVVDLSVIGHPADVVVLDLGLPDSQGGDTLRAIVDATHLPIVVHSGRDELDLALELLGKGASDYMVKGRLDGREIARVLLSTLERWKLRSELLKTQRELEQRNLELLRAMAELRILNEALADQLDRERESRQRTDSIRDCEPANSMIAPTMNTSLTDCPSRVSLRKTRNE